MKLVPRADWDPQLAWREGSVRWPLARALAELRGCESWPTVAQLGEVLARLGVQNAQGMALRTEEQAPRPRRPRRVLRCRDALYDARIDGEGILPTRAASYHDLFNGLVWASLPRAKAAISSRQHAVLSRTLPETFTRLPSTRTREQDALAMLDEGGLVLLAAPERVSAIEALALAGDREALEHAARRGEVVGLVFGHALHEHFVSSELPVRAAAVVVPLALERPSLLERADEALCRLVQDPSRFAAPEPGPGLSLHASSPLCAAPCPPSSSLRSSPPVPTTSR